MYSNELEMTYLEEDAFNHGYKLMNNHAEHIGIRRHSIFLQYNSMKCKSMKAHCKKQRQKFDNLAKFAFFFFFSLESSRCQHPWDVVNLSLLSGHIEMLKWTSQKKKKKMFAKSRALHMQPPEVLCVILRRYRLQGGICRSVHGYTVMTSTQHSAMRVDWHYCSGHT